MEWEEFDSLFDILESWKVEPFKGMIGQFLYFCGQGERASFTVHSTSQKKSKTLYGVIYDIWPLNKLS